MEFVSFGHVFNAFGEKKKILQKAVFPRRRRFSKVARRAPLPLKINN